MKNACIQILVLLLISPTLLFSQQSTKKKEGRKEYTFGIKAGTCLSKFIEGSQEENYMYRYYVTNEDKYTVGPDVGLLLEILKSKHFALQPEINYSFITHDIKYHLSINPTGNYRSFKAADYELSYSTIQFCIVPKFILGNNLNVQLLAGPYFSIPLNCQRTGNILTSYIYPGPQAFWPKSYTIYDSDIENILQSGYGIVLGLEFDIPLKTDFIGFEMRFGNSLKDITSSPNFKETSLSFSLLYKWKFKKKLIWRINTKK